MAPPLKPQIVGVPLESLNVPMESNDFSVSLSEALNSGDGSGDIIGTEQTTITERMIEGFFDRVSISTEETIATTGGGSFDTVIDLSVRDIIIFSSSRHVEVVAGDRVDLTDETFELINRVPIRKGDVIKMVTKLINKAPIMNNDDTIQSTITLKGTIRKG